LRELFGALFECFGQDKVKARDILARTAKKDSASDTLKQAIQGSYGRDRVKWTTQGLSQWLHKRTGRQIDGYRLDRFVDKSKGPHYHIVDVAEERKREAEMREFLDAPIEPPEGFAETMEKRLRKAPLRTLESTLTPRKPGRPPEPKPDPLPRRVPQHDKVRTRSEEIIAETNEVLDKATCWLLTPKYLPRFVHDPSLKRYVERIEAAGHSCNIIYHGGGKGIRLNRVTRAEAEALAKRLQLGLHEIAKHAPRVMEVQPDIIPRTCAHERQLLSRGVDDHQAEAKRRWKERQRRGWWDPFSI
jgi:hypothetical protein